MTKNKIVLFLAAALIICTCLALTVSADYYELNGNNPSSQFDGVSSFYYYGVDSDENVLFQCFQFTDRLNGTDGYYYRFSKYVAEYLIDEYYTVLGEDLALTPSGYDWSAIMSYFSIGTIQGPSLTVYWGDYDEYNGNQVNSLYSFFIDYVQYSSNTNFFEGLSALLESYNDTYKLAGLQAANNNLVDENLSLTQEINRLQAVVSRFPEQLQQRYNDGKNDGLQEGYTNGMNEANALENGLITVMNAPFYILKGVFNFEIFGINILTIILSIMTLLIVGFIVKLII